MPDTLQAHGSRSRVDLSVHRSAARFAATLTLALVLPLRAAALADEASPDAAAPATTPAAMPTPPPATAGAADEPSESEDAHAAFERAARLAQEGRLPEALQAMERAAAQDPTPPVLLNLGRLREETGDLAGAAQAYRELLRRTRDARLRALARDRQHAVERRQREAATHQRESPAPAAAPRCAPPVPCPTCAACPTCPPPPAPIYKRPWFWVVTVGGALVLAGAAAGITYALTRPSSPTPDPAMPQALRGVPTPLLTLTWPGLRLGSLPAPAARPATLTVGPLPGSHW